MPFPQGGDFVRDVSRGLNIVTSDPETDRGDGIIYAGPEVSGDYISANKDDDVERPHDIYQFSNSVARTHEIYRLTVESTGSVVLAGLLRNVASSWTYAVFPAGVSSFWRMAQFNPGVLPRYDYVFSHLFAWDVATTFTYYNRLIIYMIEALAARIKQDSAQRDITKNLVQTDYYTTISGNEDICVGDSVPPYITYIEPTASGLDVRPRDQIIEFELADAVGGVDLSTLHVEVTSSTSGTIVLLDSGVDQTGGDVNVIGDPSSYRVRYTPQFIWDYNDQVIVTISGADLPPNANGSPFYCDTPGVNYFIGDIPFQVWNQEDFGAELTVIGDVDPPYISQAVPASGTTGNSVFGPVVVKVADDLTGVDLSSLVVAVDSTVVVNNGVPTSAETTVLGDQSEYIVTYQPTTAFTYGSTVTVSVTAQDKVEIAAPNVLSTSYDFTFISDSTLVIENFQPAVGTHHNLKDVDIVVDIRDDTYGVDSDQCFFVINGTIISGTQTPLASGVQLMYHPPNDFEYTEPIRVTVHGVNANTIAPAVKEDFYNLFFGCRILYFNEEPYNHADRVDVFVRARNLEAYYKDLSTGYFFTTYTQPSSDMGASITAITPWEDLPATLNGVGPEHRYGQTVTVVFSVEDLDGHLLGPYTFTYTIEDRPD